MYIAIVSLIGVVIGALIAIIGTNINNRFILKELDKRTKMAEKMKEIDVLVLLNKKVHDILQKRDVELASAALGAEYQSFDGFDDCQITIDDYIYLQSYCAQNHYYLPTFMVDKFFENIGHRKIVLDPQEVRRIGAYTYQSGRIVLEAFSEEINQVIEDRKIELKQIRELK
ncbi:hypothetical protein [Vagococcus salmoninarum]|uniref:Uncharacterized protein n=1 Tax=Vagococcus salmoninarum TaxID=2739 RepID=A0A429ZMQ0_9ENTE|nr:hypothetical protein [Vagococcus salmoninarum]MBE9390124.1 hypothetical protein [Vagococcus salmoninarum]RST94948.1 hypothetical protein CBF35_08740 [Vagococcus salmoninarum]